MSWGDLYNTATQNYGNLGFNDQAALSGYKFGGVDESGQPIWTRADGQSINPNTDAGQTADSLVHSGTQFDKQGFFNELGIIPTNPDLTNNGDGRTNGYTPDAARQWQDMIARSYNMGSYDNLLKRETGAGQYVDDPTLGQVWVPNNRNSQTWDKSYVGATARGGGLFGALNKFADSGGLVKMLAGAVGGMGFGDLANGGLDSFGNIMNGTSGGTGYQPADFGDAGSLNDVSNYTSPTGPPPVTGGTNLIPNETGDLIQNADGTFSESGPQVGQGTGPTGTNTVIGPDYMEQFKQLLSQNGIDVSKLGSLLTAGASQTGGPSDIQKLIQTIGGAYAGSQTQPNIKPNLPSSIDTALFNAQSAANPNYNAGVAQQLKNINGDYLDPTKNPAVQGQLQYLNDQFTTKTMPNAIGQFYGKNQAGPSYENSAFANPFTSASGAPNSILGNISADYGRGVGQTIQQGYSDALKQMNTSGALAANSNTPFQNLTSYANTAYGKPIFQTDPVAGAIMGGIGGYNFGSGSTGGGTDWLKTLGGLFGTKP